MLFLTAIVAGVLTPLAPCILPLLPVVLGSGVFGRRSLVTIIASLSASVIIFTFVLKVSTVFISIPPGTWTSISAFIIGAFGVTLIFPRVWERLPLSGANARALRILSSGRGAWRDVIIGAALGPVFTTCSPTYFLVLATVLPVDYVRGSIYLAAYVAGLAAMLLMIGIAGERAARRLGVLADPHGTFKRALGIIFLAVAVIVGLGYDKKIQLWLLEAGFYDVTRIEQMLLGAPQAKPAPLVDVIADKEERIALKESRYLRAPEINAPAGFINSDAFALRDLIGKKVILLDIWTYSCINCQRTIPYLNAWYEAYEKDGLVIIGIHTPEFAFEKDIENVRWAVEQLGIEYPTVLDNDYATWKALGNNYWPRKYLIDIDGFIVFDHAGEGAYEETEIAIQHALTERAALIGVSPPESADITAAVETDERQFRHSREVYFGALRNQALGNGVSGLIGERAFVLPSRLERDSLYLEGKWTMSDEYASAAAPSRIRIDYTGRDVFFVARGDAQIRVLLDGELVGDDAGADVREGEVTIDRERLYRLIQGDGGAHSLEIQIIRGTLDAYTFTFG